MIQEAKESYDKTEKLLEHCKEIKRIWMIEQEMENLRKILMEKINDQSISQKLHELSEEKQKLMKNYM